MRLLDASLLDAAVRLVRLLDSPTDPRFLGRPMRDVEGLRERLVALFPQPCLSKPATPI